MADYSLKEQKLTDTVANINTVPVKQVGPDSVVGIATRYELDGPGIESR